MCVLVVLNADNSKYGLVIVVWLLYVQDYLDSS